MIDPREAWTQGRSIAVVCIFLILHEFNKG